MAITSALTVPVSHMIVRNYIGENLSWDDAGYWQGIWYISTMYLMVITTSLSVYYLPKLSEIQDIIPGKIGSTVNDIQGRVDNINNKIQDVKSKAQEVQNKIGEAKNTLNQARQKIDQLKIN